MSRQEKLAALASTGVTKAELDNIDGGTARGTTAIADGDGVLINDAGTMRMTSVETMATYIGTKVGGGMEFIASSGAISNAASVSFTQFNSSKYDSYLFKCYYVTPATDDVYLKAHVSTDGGSSYDTTSGNYHRNGYNDDIGFNLNANYAAGSDSNESGVSGTLELFGPHLTTYTTAYITTAVHRSTALNVEPGSTAGNKAQMHIISADVDAIQFKFNSGNIESGEITMFGIVNS